MLSSLDEEFAVMRKNLKATVIQPSSILDSWNYIEAFV